MDRSLLDESESPPLLSLDDVLQAMTRGAKVCVPLDPSMTPECDLRALALIELSVLSESRCLPFMTIHKW